jgi:hypothetical protein
VIQQYYSGNSNALESYRIHKKLSNEKNMINSSVNMYFVFYEFEFPIDEYYFLVKEFCKVKHLNRMIMQFLFKKYY